MKKTPKQHESYGLLEVSKVSVAGESGNLFGCSHYQNNAVTLKITRAEVKQRDGEMNITRLSDEDVIAEVKMSPTQFAQMVACEEIGKGIPVTLVHLNGQQMETCPFQNSLTQFQLACQRKTNKIISDLQKNADEIQELMTLKKPLNETEKDFIEEALPDSLRSIADILPDLQAFFLKEMERITLEQKNSLTTFTETMQNQEQLLPTEQEDENTNSDDETMMI